MKQLLASIFAAAMIAFPASAQSEASMCHHAGLTYSPGSLITMGQSLQKCALTEDGLAVWSPEVSENDAASSANCVSGGREFGQGSVLSASSVDLVCRNGIWFKDQ